MIIGTAGHIDHGKTTLIQALTGVDTDRLPAEKQRGITIELGFAYLPTPDGRILGFVDVPGHEKFVHTMTAGVSGIDHALLVIAADDGIMPQTREHLSILQFMGITALTIALSKADRVDTETLQQRQHEIKQWLAMQGFGSVSLFVIAAQQGLGIEALRQHLYALPDPPSNAVQQGVRYTIDRSFILAGQGVTVSGLLHTGTITVGDSLWLSPQGVPVRIRSIHAQNQAVDSAKAGERCGLVLVGLERGQVERGDWLLTEALHAPSERFDVWLRMAADTSLSLRDGLPVMLHHGAKRLPARLVLLDRESLNAGEAGLVQCCLEHPLPIFWQDRIVLRELSGHSTLAGAVVLDTQPPLRGRKKPERWLALKALHHSDPAQAIAGLLVASSQPLPGRDWARALNQPLPQLLSAAPQTLLLDERQQTWLITPEHLSQSEQRLQDQLQQFHSQYPDEPGLSVERLRRMLFPTFTAQLCQALVNHWLQKALLAQHGSFLHAPEHEIKLSEQDVQHWQLLYPFIQAGGLEPPWVRDLALPSGLPASIVRHILSKKARRGELYQVVPDLFYSPATMQQLATTAQNLAKPILSVVEFRDAIQIGRKRAIQILEFFDRIGYTRRIVGNESRSTQVKRRDERIIRNPELFKSD